MKLGHTFKISFIALKINKLRSILTILGIVIGITAIMVVMSVGNTTESMILGQISSMGPEIIMVHAGKEPKGPTDIAGTFLSDSLTKRDFEALKNKDNVPYLMDIAPVVIVPGSVSYGGETYTPMILGWSADFMAKIFDLYPETGVFFDEDDITLKSNVAIIGVEVKKELFGDSDAIGQNIKIRNKNFKVIGTFGSRGQSGFFDIDDMVLVPYSTAQDYLLGIDYFHEIAVMAKDAASVRATILDIENILRERHNITDPSKDDFHTHTQEGLTSQVKVIVGVLTLFLSLVMAISLLVGGVGIMNIMLVSVTERTKEIGLRKAIGATKTDILLQFIVEAIMLTGMGGIIGVLLGTGFSYIASIFISQSMGTEVAFNFPITATLAGIGMSVFVGLVFGLYPSRKAANKDPIEALRYE